jgi:peptide-methionine (R)-S-oxide reductase
MASLGGQDCNEEAAMGYEVELSEEEWRSKLDPERYEVLRRSATEPAFSGSLLHVDKDGRFACAGCGQVLFDSTAKFDSGSGWPSFDTAIPGAVEEHADKSHFMRRTEIRCARCGGHLGHVFDDGPTDTGLRYCVNSLSIEFEEGSEPG